MELHGARYLHVLVSCPLGWGTGAGRRRADRAARDAERACSRSSRPSAATSPPSRRSAGACPSRTTCARSGASRTSSSRRSGTDVIARIQARADRTIERFGLHAMTDKPFAITLDVGSSRANHTGSWRTERPEYVHRAAPCGHACPAGEDVAGLALPRRGGRLRGRLATDHGGQPAPGGHGPRLLPPVRDGLQPRAARRGGRHQLRRALPRRRGARAGAGRSSRCAPPSGRRVLVVGAGPVRALGRLPPDAARARGRDPRRRPARRAG